MNDVGFRMRGDVGSTVTGPASYHFEYGPTTEYGSSTPVETLVVDAYRKYPVDELVTGLDEATDYHYRLCAVDADDAGICGPDAIVHTSSGQDSVVGRGFVILDGANRIMIGSSVMDAHSEPGGANPTGRASASPGPHAPFFDDVGDVTCLRVEGNRAAVGILVDAFELADPESPRDPLMVFIEDNGPTGDRWSMIWLDQTTTDCPIPTAADFTSPPYPGGPDLFPPTIFTGGFAVHDHS